jgi:hypothetical protein
VIEPTLRIVAAEQRECPVTVSISDESHVDRLTDPVRGSIVPLVQGVIVEFQYDADGFDPGRIAGIAHEARGRFEGLPGLRQKTFTVDDRNHRATNVYLWDSEEAAREFFDEALVERVTGLYGVRPTVTFVEIAELVDNAG